MYIILIPAFKQSTKVSPDYINEKLGGSRFSETWFQFVPSHDQNMYSSESYIHFGKFSKGCITYLFRSNTKSDWETLYMKLITSRLDKLSLGTLIVTV